MRIATMALTLLNKESLHIKPFTATFYLDRVVIISYIIIFSKEKRKLINIFGYDIYIFEFKQ